MYKNEYKVSIITAVYNGAQTIEQTIQSVLRQSYKNIEYIVIDGLSTDGTQKIVENYIDSVYWFVSEKDNGLYYAMNKGLRKATGDIIGIINSDDWYSENAIETVVECFCRTEADIVYGNLVSILPDGQEKLIPAVSLDSMWHQMALPHPAVFIKRDIYKKFGTFNIKYKIASDYDLLLRFYSQNTKFEYVDKTIAYFRPGGLSSQNQRQMWDETRTISLSYLNACPNKAIVLSHIEEKYKWRCFTLEIDGEKKLLLELLCKYFQTNIRNIIIWGTGDWGERCYEALKGKVTILNFVDNDEKRWGHKLNGVKIISPNELRKQDIYILIAVKGYGEKIKLQIEHMSNSKLRSVCITDLEELYYNSKDVKHSGD